MACRQHPERPFQGEGDTGFPTLSSPPPCIRVVLGLGARANADSAKEEEWIQVSLFQIVANVSLLMMARQGWWNGM